MRQVIYFFNVVTGARLCTCGGQLCAILVALSLGCARGNQPELGTVHGRITLDGKPLAGVTISFQPGDGGRQSSDETDEQGRYDLIYLRDIHGAKVGKHRVVLGSSAPDAPKSDRLPARFNTQSTLAADVVRGDNQCDFTLISH